eukprot:11193390-Alexandrium_andersonii.AAC.1
MSASLVGSEMCIRDRTLLTTLLVLGVKARPDPCAQPCADSKPATGRATVSYTHLTLPTICSV